MPRKAKPLNRSPYSIRIDGDISLNFQQWVQKVVLQHCDHNDGNDCWVWGLNYGRDSENGPTWRVPQRYGHHVQHRKHVLVSELVAIASPIIAAPDHGRVDMLHTCGNNRCCNPLHIMWDWSDERDRGQ